MPSNTQDAHDAVRTWKDAPIHGCDVTPLTKYQDDRGWLAEFFRRDELDDRLHPVMGYLSLTLPGVARGPHEHCAQTDLFVFFSGTFRIYLWDDRPGSPTYGHRQILEHGAAEPAVVIVPPGVVHAYRNVGDTEALIINCPNQLYAGEGKKHPVDEIRHEEDEESPFQLD